MATTKNFIYVPRASITYWFTVTWKWVSVVKLMANKIAR